MLVPGVEAGYERFLGRELSNQDAILLVAEDDGKITGYAYGTSSLETGTRCSTPPAPCTTSSSMRKRVEGGRRVSWFSG